MQIQVQGVHKGFGSQTVLRNCGLAIERGEIVTLLGPSGCGKTTLLRCIAGFYIPDEGRILIGDRDVTFTPPNRREVGMVFQSYALFPHMTVEKNVAYGLRIRKVPRAEIARRVAATLDLVSLSALADRYPSQLSGGQQQRVAVARVLVLEPLVLLLDEPFNALDAKLRLAMQVELRKLIKKVGITSIFVTHDQREALTVSDRVAVMEDGMVVQIGEPLALYDRPASSYVADFIGAANLLRGAAKDGRVEVIPGSPLATEADGEVVVVVRPESLTIAAPGDGKAGWTGTVSFVNPLGPTVEYEIDVGRGRPVKVMAIRRSGEVGHALGTRVRVGLRDESSCIILPARG